ncbi:hypothetical protein E2562_038156 [Oryza meyeriana var. granulata]|uniref:Uncharacterized protein n=1 Tax=Oryza meyeriana var. granulata TaxID=110450 RepID=A0A6G1CM19_9ORYZ|nr:hypothetical protein E2562_038156 [Oryza meyeriana var. granulata]
MCNPYYQLDATSNWGMPRFKKTLDQAKAFIVFEPLVKVLRMVDGDGPSLAFTYGEILEAKKQIMEALNNLKGNYNPIFAHIDEEDNIDDEIDFESDKDEVVPTKDYEQEEED